MKLVKQVKALLHSRANADLASSALFYDGSNIVIVEDAGVVGRTVMTQAGQGLFSEEMVVATFPLSAWLRAAEDSARVIDIDSVMNDRKEAQRRREATRSVILAPQVSS